MTHHPESKHKEPEHTNGEDCIRPCGTHAMVGGAYPNEFKYFCKWCGDSPRDSDLDESCRFCYYSQTPARDPAKCAMCGYCDCSDGHHGEAILCQMVGECSGMAYDVVLDGIGDTLCLDCFTEMMK